MAENLTAFLAQNAKKIERAQVAVSTRFQAGGKPVLWEIGCITAAENTRLRTACMRQMPTKRGQSALQFDPGLYQTKLCAKCVLVPDLNDDTLQDSYGVRCGEELVATMLTPGEFEGLCGKILEINGFQNEEELVEQAKN